MGKYIAAGIALLIGVLGVAIAFQDYLLSELFFKPDLAFEEMEAPAVPDYAKAESWAAHPDLMPNNHAMKQPGGGLAIGGPRAVDVFYIHPTSYLGGDVWNAGIDDEQVNWNTDSFPLAQQLSLFAQCCALYAPRYRQSNLYSFLNNGGDGAKAMDLAYQDVAAAFDAFLQARDPARPFILAGHSQGTVHGLRLLQQKIDGTALHQKLVAAYLPGYWLTEAMIGPATTTPICKTAQQTRCLLSWDTYMEGGDRYTTSPQAGVFIEGAYRLPEGQKGICVNPVTGAKGGASDIEDHEGGIALGPLAPPPGFGDDPEPYREFELPELSSQHVATACDDTGTLKITEPEDPHFRAQTMPGKGLQVMDYGLFWGDIRKDVKRRLAAFR